MRILLLGATGGTGHELLKRLMKDNHHVKVLVRNPDKLKVSEINQSEENQLEIIQGGVFDPEKLTEHFKACELVISALGTGTNNKYTEIYSQGGRNILSAMRASGLIHNAYTGKYRAQDRHCPKGGRRISRADLADFIVKQIDSDEYVFKKPVVAY